MIILTSKEAVDIQIQGLSFFDRLKIDKKISKFIKSYIRQILLLDVQLDRDEKILERFDIAPYDPLYKKYSLAGLSSDEIAKVLLSTSIAQNIEQMDICLVLKTHKKFSKAQEAAIAPILDKYYKLRNKLFDVAALKGASDKIYSVLKKSREPDYLENLLSK